MKIFRHPLLQHFMLSVFCKLPIQPMTHMAHLRQLLMLRILLSVFQFRINGRCVRAGTAAGGRRGARAGCPPCHAAFHTP